LDWPPVGVQSRASDATQLAALFSRVSSTWSRLGQQDPYFSVCTDPRLLGAEIGDQGKEELYASGQDELRHLASFAARSGIDLAGRSCLELGCGVGRVTRWLAPVFRRVHAIDVSPGHLAIAQRELSEAGIENVSLTQISSPEDLRQIVGYDVFFSIIVLQHNPPPLIAYILMQVLTNLNPGGVGFFQVPTYDLDYSFSIDEYLNKPIPEEAQVEMHVLPQRDVFRIVQATGCRLLEIREADYTGIRNGVSNTFFVQKELEPGARAGHLLA
jgi:2-polyprenyl-3-methyl-5-hydroxy-6-metoxy-1,4-benzoquinol methylase